MQSHNPATQLRPFSRPIAASQGNVCLAPNERTDMTDFYRNVHCVMGLPIDAMSMDDAVHHLQRARITRTKCFFSTPNLHFMMACRKQPKFRESVCMSDLSLADGMPLVWVARLLHIPIHERVSGSDLFERLRQQTESLWRVFFFGGQKGVGQTACLAIGDQSVGVLPTGYIYPGFVNTEEMSREDLVQCINQSASDMVVVSLGAAKGQDWICRNHQRIDAPVIGHLGAFPYATKDVYLYQPADDSRFEAVPWGLDEGWDAEFGWNYTETALGLRCVYDPTCVAALKTHIEAALTQSSSLDVPSIASAAFALSDSAMQADPRRGTSRTEVATARSALSATITGWPALVRSQLQ